jgi:DNA-binding PadR family transcriptional regulator
MDAMALDIFMLSSLRARPSHGYDLKRRVQRPSSLTQPSNNSIYPTLRKFEQAGYVTSATQVQESGPARKIYSITQSGVARLAELLSSLPDDLASSQEEFLVRVGFFDELTPDQRREVMDARLASLERSAAQVHEFIAETDASPERDWRRIVMRQFLAEIESEQRWIASLDDRAAR